MAADCVASAGGAALLSVTILPSSHSSSGTPSARQMFIVSRTALPANSRLLRSQQLGSLANGPAVSSSSSCSSTLRRGESTTRRWVPRSRRQASRDNEKGLHAVLCTQMADTSSSTALNAETKPVSCKFVLVLGATGGVEAPLQVFDSGLLFHHFPKQMSYKFTARWL
jgi:hypothetical protein